MYPRRSTLAATLLAVALAADLGQAQPPPAPEPTPEPRPPGVVPVSEPTDSEFDEPRSERLETRLHLEGSSNDNFFRAPGGEEESLRIGRYQFRLLWKMFADEPYKVFAEVQETNYETLPSATTFLSGFRLEGDRHFVETRVEYSKDRPSTDTEDDPDPADVERFDGEYTFRLSHDWQTTAATELEERTHDRPGNDSQTLEVGLALRWRGAGAIFSPELGIARARKNADRPNDEYTQEDLYLRMRSRPVDRLYVSLRYRDRDRDYDVLVERASNFARSDQRGEWSLHADFTASDLVIVNLEYEHIDTDSSRRNKSFTSSEISLGLTLRHKFAGTGQRHD